MKKFLYIYFIGFCLVACETKNTSDKQDITVLQESVNITVAGGWSKEDIDPYFGSVIKDALEKVDSLYKGEDLQYKYVFKDSSSMAETFIKAGKLFNNQPYALLHIDGIEVGPLQGVKFIEVYKIEGKRTFRKKLLYIEDFALQDSIFDVNGDGINDLSINYDPSYIYLFDPKTETFSTPYKFKNVTFYPKEGVIRGVETEIPGVAGLYKKKWVGNKIEVVEYIYPDYTTNGKTFIRTKKQGEYPERKDGEPIEELPKEYLDVKALELFLDYDIESDLPFLEETLEKRNKK